MKVIADDLQFPEGPVCLPDGDLLVVEIRRGTLTRVKPDGKKTIVAHLGGGPNGAAVGPDGHVYVCNNGGFSWAPHGESIMPIGTPDDYTNGRIERVNLATGKAEVLYDSDGVRKLRGPNDIVFDANGGFWFTDMGKTRDRSIDRGSVCYAKTDGSMVREVIFPLLKPNGIGLSPDGNTLYVAETDTARVWAWQIDAPGTVAFEKSPVPCRGRLVFSSSTWRRFDSLAVEADGNICVATLDPGGITVCRPEGGELEFVAVDDPFTTNICFGGADMKTAYITASFTGRLLQTQWQRAGLKLN